MKRINLTIVSAAVVLATVGCASSPNKIAAQYVSPMAYQGYDCEQIALEQNRIERRTGELYQSLKKEANADKWQMGVGLILFWPALFMLEGGDGPEASEYARLRGEYNALSEVSIMKKCQIQFKEDLGDVIKEQNKDDAVSQ
ncbi:MAG: metal ABC transporter ATP-binding protein [Hyphomonas sp.]|jgi:hypothetical protein|uniref:hypothetical protein n=1 Tax=Hyphomonas sp. TaxID=87 RepID=UPI001B180EEA|nr:hypothetical protein [Hyphomonas sp.]MBO6582774.1 metal ABC transporter ATP-binding protein [Hyphomonas sp.]MDF1805099.1 hypothetical protein [Hyphomonas sp.]|tara:strand:- start:91 stop:516 length:426 start_codon:yes stop_codon:yes gene_type:complete